MGPVLACPNCGARHTIENPGIAMVVCEHCHAVVLRDGDTVAAAGVQSVLPESDARLFMHATGALDGVGFRVIGHLRYEHDRGAWDEWYLALDDGESRWLTEDERELALEQPLTPDEAPVSHEALAPGDKVRLQGVTYSVLELGTARCQGGEGQVPFRILPGETYPYADLVSQDGTRFATLEYDREGTPGCFTGRTLDHESLVIHDEPPPSAAFQPGSSFDCANCGAALTAPDRVVRTLVCAYCGTALDLGAAELRVLGRNPGDVDPEFDLEVGAAGEIGGRSHQVAGRMLWVEEDAWGEYPARAYLLFHPESGYAWLEEENGHWLLTRATQQGPNMDPFGLTPRSRVKVGASTFLYFEEGTTRLRWVDGALPWLARVGDEVHYCDCIDPPRLYSVERTPGEIEYSVGEYVPHTRVADAFGVTLPAPRGVHPGQPAPAKVPWLGALAGWGFVFALLNLAVAAFLSASGSHGVVLDARFPAAVYTEPQLSAPFDLPGGPVVDVHVAADVNNQWVHGSFVLLNEKDEVVAEVERTVEYYHGYDDGRWSEGSQRTRARLRSPGPGRYRLAAQVECPGYDNAPDSVRAGRRPTCPDPVRVRVEAGGYAVEAVMAAFGLSLALALLAGGVQVGRRYLFEARRWQPVTKDDDDDDYDFDDWD